MTLDDILVCRSCGIETERRYVVALRSDGTMEDPTPVVPCPMCGAADWEEKDTP